MAGLLVPAVALGAGLLFLLSQSDEAKAAPAPSSAPLTPGGPPADVLARMAGALASGSPETMRAEADKLKREGYPLQASELLRVAAEVAAGVAVPVVVPSSVSTPVPASKPKPKPKPKPEPPAVTTSPGFVPPTVVQQKPPAQSTVLQPAPASSSSAKPPTSGTPVAAPAPGAAVKDPTPNARTLVRGMKGPDVGSWQRILKAFKYDIGKFGPAKDGVDNDFGGATEKATRQFQSDSFKMFRDPAIKIDGKVGPETRKAVVRRSKATMAGELVVIGESEGVEGSGVGFDGVPSHPLAASPLPGIIAPAVDDTPMDPRRQLAAAVAVNLLESGKGQEDRTLIGRFQKTEGVRVTGLYGPGTAVKLADYGIVPPWPRYWTKSGRSNTRRRYRELLLARAAADPARADEWRGAAVAEA